jgi:poly(A) polymerase
MSEASIKGQAWLTAAPTRAVIAALEAARPGCARFVGGCVRNALIGRPIDDIDIATTLTPDEVIAAVSAHGLAAHPTGLAHGTVTVVADRTTFEVTTLRRDVETDGRHAVVAFTQDWAEDARRRDFRMNALYADADGVVFDPTGAGVADARAGRVIFIGDARDRIREDFLRILRFFRFSAWYGRAGLDADGLAACADLREGLQGLSAERIWHELKKLLGADDPRAALLGMQETGVWPIAAAHMTRLDRLFALIGHETDAFIAPDPLRRIAVGLPDAAAASAFAARMKASGAERDRLVAALGREPRVVSYLSMRELRRALYALGLETFEDRAFIAWAGDPNPRVTAQWRGLLALARGWVRPAFALSGDEVIAAGVPAGPKVGAVMREVEAWWIDADFPDDKLALVERLKAVAQALG